jgi:APA family basic amino acid/polyamine antiporter
MSPRHSLFIRKPLALLLEEMKGDNRLRRVLGPVQLTSLGVGAIIGTGIFVLTGQAAHDKAGPALILSFVVSGLACVFAALCYAEFASMAPVAGSAYTSAYATMGELFAGSSAGTWCASTPWSPQPSRMAGRTTSRTSSASSASEYRTP